VPLGPGACRGDRRVLRTRTAVRATVVAVFVCVLSACGGSDARQTPRTVGGATSDVPAKLNGVYKTRIDSEQYSGAFNGVWRLRLQSNGAYILSRTSKSVMISGSYEITGHTITFTDRGVQCTARPGSGGCRYFECRKPGRYSYKLSGQTLAFTEIYDQANYCERPEVLIGGGGFRRI
jgi:hypothetical protein